MWPIKKLLKWYDDDVNVQESNPYGLDDRKFLLLEELWDSDEFDAFVSLIDVEITLQTERLMGQSDNVERLIGRIQGLRESVILVDRILKMRESADDAKRRRQSDAERRRVAATSSHFNSPFGVGD